MCVHVHACALGPVVSIRRPGGMRKPSHLHWPRDSDIGLKWRLSIQISWKEAPPTPSPPPPLEETSLLGRKKAKSFFLPVSFLGKCLGGCEGWNFLAKVSFGFWEASHFPKAEASHFVWHVSLLPSSFSSLPNV